MSMPLESLLDGATLFLTGGSFGGHMKKNAAKRAATAFGWIFSLLLLCATAPGSVAHAAAIGCGQGQVESLWGAPQPPAISGVSGKVMIGPLASSPSRVTPFYQWESNDGYCGEVSLIQAGLANGQWMSQYNARLVCGAFYGQESQGSGASLLQAGNPISGGRPNYNAQLLIEAPNTGVSGAYDFAYAGRCASNAGLAAVTYPYNNPTGYKSANVGLAGYQDYMRWVKAQVIAGRIVTIATLFHGGTDPQYDHEVTVLGIYTSNPTSDAYDPNDVIVFDDHGVYTLTKSAKGKWSFAWNPSVPYGAGGDAVGCTPYVFSYTFGQLANTRSGANATGAPGYSILIPGSGPVQGNAGNTASSGNGGVSIPVAHNYAYAVTGPLLASGVQTLPVSITIGSTASLATGAPNPQDPVAGFNYETPYIGGPVGTCDHDKCASNVQPAAMQVSLNAMVSGLTPGQSYTLYEYDFPTITGASTGTAAALPVPTSNFHAACSSAQHVYAIPAQGTLTTTTFTKTLQTTSDKIVVLRAVAGVSPCSPH